MLIRQAQSGDAQTASELIFSSTANLLALMFNVDAEQNALAFLKSAFAQQEGQFGWGNHWVLEQDDQVVAIASAWHCELHETFHRGTLESISHYFGVSRALEIIQRCQVLQKIFPAPQKNELCIGHFAVSDLYQRKGLGAHLIAHLRKIALNKGKNALTLDVEQTNQAAQLFYQELGFRMTSHQAPMHQLNGSVIGPYSHMFLRL